MSLRMTGRIVGVLFLAAFVCYGVGSALVDRPLGPALMLLLSLWRRSGVWCFGCSTARTIEPP